MNKTFLSTGQQEADNGESAAPLSWKMIWITSLRESEVGVTGRILDDLRPILSKHKVKICNYSPKNKDEFISIINNIKLGYNGKYNLIIHLDTHGDSNDGLFITPSGEFIDWDELGNSFRTINEITDNNLIVVSAICFGFHAIRSLSIDKLSPFDYLIGPEQTTSSGEIEDNIISFYEEFLETNDIYTARLKLSKWKLYSCTDFFRETLIRYIKDNCFGSGGKKRIERLISETVSTLGYTPSNLGKFRRVAKKFVKNPNQSLINKYAPVFLSKKGHGLKIAPLISEAKARLKK